MHQFFDKLSLIHIDSVVHAYFFKCLNADWQVSRFVHIYNITYFWGIVSVEDCICWGFLRGYKTLYPLRRRGGEQRSARQGKAFPYFFISFFISFLTKPPDFFIIDRNVSRNLYLIKLRISWKMNKGVHSICGIIFPNGVSVFFFMREKSCFFGAWYS